MNDQNEKKYKQLALFSVIVAEVVITPSALGGLVFWALRKNSLQMPLTVLAAFVGLGIAIYRIYQVYQNQNRDES